MKKLQEIKKIITEELYPQETEYSTQVYINVTGFSLLDVIKLLRKKITQNELADLVNTYGDNIKKDIDLQSSEVIDYTYNLIKNYEKRNNTRDINTSRQRL
jgi:hypothetical protein